MKKIVKNKSPDCHVAVVGAGPYGLSSAAYLRAAGVETRVFGEPMSFWQNQMPAGMCLRSNWGASHIADPKQEFTLDAYCREKGNHISKPIPLDRFVDYGRWYQSRALRDLEERSVVRVDLDARGFKVVLADGEEFISKRVVVATGISTFASQMCIRDRVIYEELLAHLADLKEKKDLWITIPGEVNRWWRQRAEMKLVEDGEGWRIEGAGNERARIAYASEQDGQLIFTFQPAALDRVKSEPVNTSK